jgi:hypothetical protein
MDRAEIKRVLHEAMEELADIEHERWSHWQRFLHGKAVRQTDGSLVIPADLVSRWERQMQARYADLTEGEKEGDREQVRRYLPTIIKVLSE